jgi:CubicO group peptidase (beta-lactamase class C family)
VPAERPILISDLLTLRMGLGAIFSPKPYPITRALREREEAVRSMDDYAAAIGELPLMRQPGEAWMYDTGFQLLGVLIERAAGWPLGEFLEARIFAPLGMSDTGFHVPEDKLDRLPTCYWRNHRTGEVEVFDPAGPESHFAQPPGFASLAGGLVSTVDDYLAFATMMLDQGKYQGPGSYRKVPSNA